MSSAPIRPMKAVVHCSPSVCTRIGEQHDLLLPAGATSSFTTVAGQGWLVGLAEPALDAGTTLAYRRVRRQGEVGSSDRDGLFEQEIGAQKHDRSSRGPRKAVSRFGRSRTSGSRVSRSQKSRMNANARLRAYDARQHALARRSLRHRGVRQLRTLDRHNVDQLPRP